MRALITGASGFVGPHLIAHLQSLHHNVFGSFCGTHPHIRDVHWMACDVCNDKQVKALLRRSQPDVVFHLAALSSVKDSFSREREFYEVNFYGTLNVLEAVRNSTPKAHVLLVGSGQVYGQPKSNHRITERDLLLPQNPYATSKAAADLLGFEYWKNYGLNVVRARPFNHTGSGQAAEFVCSDFARQAAEVALQLRPPEIQVGDLEIERDFCDVRDVVSAYELLARKGRPGEAYNVAGGRSYRVRQILDLLCAMAGKKIRVEQQGARLRRSDVSRVRVNTGKIRLATGWKPKYSLEETLGALFSWWKDCLSMRKP